MRALLLTATLLGSLPALGHEATIGQLTIEHPWARPAISGNGAAYMMIENAGTDTDRLTGATSDIAKMVELHTHTIDAQGVARMRPVSAIEIGANDTTKLAPGGFHVMLIGLQRPLVEGDTFPLRLHFERSGGVDLEVTVEKPTGHGEMHDAGNMEGAHAEP